MAHYSYKYWNDCVDPDDLELLWTVPEVSTEWLAAGESKGQKVHLSRDPDGQPYLTQTEMAAVADIVIHRHFNSQVDTEMIRALAELESDRQLLAKRYDKKKKETTLGIMQISPQIATLLVRESGYTSYDVLDNPDLLHRPFVNVYFGAAYLIWLMNFENKQRTEEFVIRAYKGGTRKATHKSTLPYWKRYVSVKESLPARKHSNERVTVNNASSSAAAASPSSFAPPPLPAPQNTGVADASSYWDSRASPEDMMVMWNYPEVQKEWSKTSEKQGRVRFSQDAKMRPYLSRVELKGIAQIILAKYFSSRGVKPSILCAVAEVVSMRFVNGVEPRIGIMGLDYSTAYWLYMELGYRSYKLESDADLTNPFVSMYFGAAYLAYLSQYEGRERTLEFVVQAYIVGPNNVNPQNTNPVWLKFEEAVSHYDEKKVGRGNQGSCSIM